MGKIWKVWGWWKHWINLPDAECEFKTLKTFLLKALDGVSKLGAEKRQNNVEVNIPVEITICFVRIYKMLQ
jgi:hypothetical protein